MFQAVGEHIQNHEIGESTAMCESKMYVSEVQPPRGEEEGKVAKKLEKWKTAEGVKASVKVIIAAYLKLPVTARLRSSWQKVWLCVAHENGGCISRRWY